MNNLICIFFGHKDNKKFDNEDSLTVDLYKIPMSYIKQCKRCKRCYFERVEK